MRYNWQQSDWPNFTFNLAALENLLLAFSEKTGRLGGLLDAMPQNRSDGFRSYKNFRNRRRVP
jgi:Fic family protein